MTSLASLPPVPYAMTEAAAAAAVTLLLRPLFHPPNRILPPRQKEIKIPCTLRRDDSQSMSGRASGGSGAKRPKRDEVRQAKKDADAEAAALEMAAQAEVPLSLLSVVMWLHGVLVWLQLCSPQGDVLFSFVRVSSRVPRPFAGNPVYSMSLSHAVRLRVVGSGMKGKLMRLLSLGFGGHLEPERNRSACHKLMQSNARRVAAGLAASVRVIVAKKAEQLCASGQCAAAVVALQEAMKLGDLPSRALLAWWLIDGRVGVAMNKKRALELAEEGVRLGCHHCLGVLARLTIEPSHPIHLVNRAAMPLARDSADKGSRYGLFSVGLYNYLARNGRTFEASVDFFQQAAAMGLDSAQCYMGRACLNADVKKRWYQLAAAQGHVSAANLLTRM